MELVILIVVISILSFVLITKFSFTASNLMAARVKLMNDLRYSQSLALNHGGTYGIDFSPATESYTLFKDTPATPVKDPLKPTTNYTVSYAGSEEFNGVNLVSASFGGIQRIDFNWQGIPYVSGTPLGSEGTIVLQNAAGTTTVRVTPQTGRISY